MIFSDYKCLMIGDQLQNMFGWLNVIFSMIQYPKLGAMTPSLGHKREASCYCEAVQ